MIKRFLAFSFMLFAIFCTGCDEEPLERDFFREPVFTIRFHDIESLEAVQVNLHELSSPQGGSKNLGDTLRGNYTLPLSMNHEEIIWQFVSYRKADTLEIERFNEELRTAENRRENFVRLSYETRLVEGDRRVRSIEAFNLQVVEHDFDSVALQLGSPGTQSNDEILLVYY